MGGEVGGTLGEDDAQVAAVSLEDANEDGSLHGGGSRAPDIVRSGGIRKGDGAGDFLAVVDPGLIRIGGAVVAELLREYLEAMATSIGHGEFWKGALSWAWWTRCRYGQEPSLPRSCSKTPPHPIRRW